MEVNKCRICDNIENLEQYVLKEMMYGTQEEFEYFRCSDCGCMQIKKFPVNIEKYYPDNYLSFSKRSLIKKYLVKKRDLYAMNGKDLLGRVLTIVFGYPDFYPWFSQAILRRNDFILDIGCGKGELLFNLKNAGFKNLLGIDPYIEKDIVYNEELKILKRELHQITDSTFDWVMFHHSFEHLKNPVKTFELLRDVVKKGGNILIRIPVIDSYAWEIYKTDWVQLDPPRHFFIHTKKSIKYLADKFGFKIQKIIYDSTALQFFGSEQYKRGIPLMDKKSHWINPKGSIFNRDELKEFKENAEELNKKKNGDSACFFLNRTN